MGLWFKLTRLEERFAKALRLHELKVLSDAELIDALFAACDSPVDTIPSAGAHRALTLAHVHLVMAALPPAVEGSPEYVDRFFPILRGKERFDRWCGECRYRLSTGEPNIREELNRLYRVGEPIDQLKGEDRWFECGSAIELVLQYRVWDVITWLVPGEIPEDSRGGYHPSCTIGWDTDHLRADAVTVLRWLGEQAKAGDTHSIEHLRLVAREGHSSLRIRAALRLPLDERAAAAGMALDLYQAKGGVDVELWRSAITEALQRSTPEG